MIPSGEILRDNSDGASDLTLLPLDGSLATRTHLAQHALCCYENEIAFLGRPQQQYAESTQAPEKAPEHTKPGTDQQPKAGNRPGRYNTSYAKVRS
jgi:hypothetical protein